MRQHSRKSDGHAPHVRFVQQSLRIRLGVFTDGAKNLRESIFEHFGPKQALWIDWHHLKKKVNSFLSMGLNGSELRKDALLILMPLLWRGKTLEACEWIARTPDESLKKTKEGLTGKHLADLIKYLSKQSPHLPNYLLRKASGLRNSSNSVECANNILVSHRQKKNGMSWSPMGSAGLAAIKVLMINGELEDFLRTGNVSLTCPSPQLAFMIS
jgi:hypothetical protein